MRILLVNSGEAGQLTVRKAITGYVPWITDSLRRLSPILPRNIVRKVLGGFGTSEKRFPLGLGYLGAMLTKNHHEVTLVDRFCSTGAWVDDIHRYDFVGIYASTPCFTDTLRVISLLESQEYRGKIAVGGPHVSVFPHTVPDRVDYVVQGEGEYVINDLVEGAYEPGTMLLTPRIVDLDLLPRPDYNLYLKSKAPYLTAFGYSSAAPVFNMNTSRSCPLTCKFCSVKDIWGRMWRGQSAERVLDDIAYLKQTFGVGGIYFREDYFLANRKRSIDIAEGMIRQNLVLDWACETRVDVASDEEFVKLMAQSGCRGFYIGAESGSQRMLDKYDKRTKVEQIVKTCENARKHNIKITMALIVAHPEETTADRLATFNLIRKTNPAVIFASPYRDDVLKHGQSGFPEYGKRSPVQVDCENGSWAGQQDRESLAAGREMHLEHA